MLFALYSISLLQSNTLCFFHPPEPVYISSTLGLCKAWEFGSARAREYACSGLYLHIALVLLRPKHYLLVTYSLMVFQLSVNEETIMTKSRPEKKQQSSFMGRRLGCHMLL